MGRYKIGNTIQLLPYASNNNAHSIKSLCKFSKPDTRLTHSPRTKDGNIICTNNNNNNEGPVKEDATDLNLADHHSCQVSGILPETQSFLFNLRPPDAEAISQAF